MNADGPAHLVLRISTSPSGRIIYEYVQAAVPVSPSFFTLAAAAEWLRMYRRINKPE